MKSRDLPRFALSFSFLLGLTTALRAGPVPSNKPLHFPDWWFLQDVIVRVDPGNLTPNYNIPGTYQAADDFAAANIGQLKHIAVAAAAEMDLRLVGGAGDQIGDLVLSWMDASSPEESRDDFAALNLGQLKAVASLFYARLGVAVPWWGGVPDDFTTANLGQLKMVFSFAISVVDTDDDGLSDEWEFLYFGDLGRDGLGDFDGDGVCDRAEMQADLNPTKRDTDGGGMGDGYEIAMELDPLLADGGADKDGDSVINQEDARPNGASIGRLTVVISLPANGANYP